MCTLVILRRPGHRWPVLIGANRDEMIDRASKPPGRHWPDRPELVAGRDILAGGPRVELKPLKDGLSMIAAGEIDDLGTRRLELALPAFRAWPIPDPDRDEWDAWQTLLGSTRAPPNEPPSTAMRFRTDGYGTVS